MRIYLKMLAVAGVLGLGAAAHASLIGSSVTGVFNLPGYGTENFFDPANGYVPSSGYENSAGPTVAISSSATEFGYKDGNSQIAADFGTNTLFGLDIVNGNSLPLTFQFTDTAFTGLTIAQSNNTFPGLTYSLTGDTITIQTATIPNPGFYNAQFVLSSTPEPASAALLAVGGVALLARRRA